VAFLVDQCVDQLEHHPLPGLRKLLDPVQAAQQLETRGWLRFVGARKPPWSLRRLLILLALLLITYLLIRYPARPIPPFPPPPPATTGN
jgi:hypothetical protein